jgi:hypothetical protein
MDRMIFAGVAVAFVILGICMAIWPARVARQSRDAGDGEPGAGELVRMRVVGAAMAALAAYGLYAIAAGLPGAEFSPV